MNNPDEFSYITVGCGVLNDKKKVVVSASSMSGACTYMGAASARFLAMQILMAANEIDPQEDNDET